MYYPIFTSIVNTIDTTLSKRGIATRKFKTWEDNRIHAAGLEISIGLGKSSQFINSLSINLDWDMFKEARLAHQMEGMENHPILSELNDTSSFSPIIDVELSWLFNVDRCQPVLPGTKGNYRIENASRWMESISKEMNEMLKSDEIMTRWHVEIDGDEQGRYLSAINLISYFQYSLADLQNLNDSKNVLNRYIHDILLKGNKVIFASDEIILEAIAA